MTTLLETLGTSTPVSFAIARKLKWVKAGIVCHIYFRQNMKDGVCRISNNTFAECLGMSAGAVSTNIKQLLTDGWIENTQPLVKGNKANHYKVTQKFFDTIHSSDEQQHSSNEGNVQEMNDNVHEVNGEEVVKEVPKETIKDNTSNTSNYEVLEGVKTPEPFSEMAKRDQHNALFMSLCEACDFDHKMGAALTKLNFEKAAKKSRELGRHPDEFRRFRLWFDAHNWKGKRGDAPKLKDIKDEWGGFLRWEREQSKFSQAVEMADTQPAAAPDAAEQFLLSLQANPQIKNTPWLAGASTQWIGDKVELIIDEKYRPYVDRVTRIIDNVSQMVGVDWAVQS